MNTLSSGPTQKNAKERRTSRTEGFCHSELWRAQRLGCFARQRFCKASCEFTFLLLASSSFEDAVEEALYQEIDYLIKLEKEDLLDKPGGLENFLFLWELAEVMAVFSNHKPLIYFHIAVVASFLLL